jgi:hypothetical protein
MPEVVLYGPGVMAVIGQLVHRCQIAHNVWRASTRGLCFW